MAILDLVNPYMLYIKIAAIALVAMIIIGIAYYIKSTFAERDTLIADKAKLQAQVATEQQKVAVAMEQLRIWQETVDKMNKAIKNIKVESNTYIEGVENEKPPAIPADNNPIPFIMPGMSANTTLPRHENYSTSRASTTITQSRPIQTR